ncbi:MAG: hypothetical protein HYS25_02245 [Ignavibacteriales bacterium]|nr:hypothetical protein [Ignavibacteriales bacterium]
MKPINLIKFLGLLAAFIIFGTAAKLQAQEHPSKEHPKSEATLNPEVLAKEIEQYVETESKKHGGYFPYYDKQTKTKLDLKFDHVHKGNLSKIADGVYFACSDFKSSDGKVYDLDFFIKETDDGLKVTQQKLHKINGKARYTWYEEDGVWKSKEK